MSFGKEFLQRLTLGLVEIGAKAAVAATDGDPNTKAKDVFIGAAKDEATGEGIILPSSLDIAFDKLDTSSVFGPYEAEAEGHIKAAVKLAFKYQAEKI